MILPLTHSLVEYQGQTALLAEACASLVSGGHLAEACKVGGNNAPVTSGRLTVLWAGATEVPLRSTFMALLCTGGVLLKFSHFLVFQVAVAGVFTGHVISLAKVACQMVAERHVLEAARLTSCVATNLADQAIDRLFILYEDCRRRVTRE